MATPEKHRNHWIWVSAALAVVAVGLLVWGLSTKSDKNDAQKEADSAQQELASTEKDLGAAQKELDSTKKELDSANQQAGTTETEQEQKTGRRVILTGATFATIKSLYDDLVAQLGASEEDLATAEKDLEEADKKQQQAEKDAADAEQKAAKADNETDKAKAEADQATAEKEAAQSKTQVVAGCAKSYLSAFGTLFDGDDVKAQAAKVSDQFKAISADCKAALSGG